MMFTEVAACLASASFLWSSAAPILVGLLFAAIVLKPSAAEKKDEETKTMMKSSTDDDVSTEAGESDSEASTKCATEESDSESEAPGLAAPLMYTVQPRPRDFGLDAEPKGEWAGKQWTGYHAKQARLAARRAEGAVVKEEKKEVKASPVGKDRPTPPWAKRSTLPQ